MPDVEHREVGSHPSGSRRGTVGGVHGPSHQVRESGGERIVDVGQIEKMGWRLEHASFVFVETGQHKSSSDEDVDTEGEIVGIYLFRTV